MSETVEEGLLSHRILPLRFSDVGLTIRGQSLIEGLSFDLAAGAPTFILGPNGAGKSLTLRIAHGLIRPTAGRVVWSGADAGRAGMHQAMVFERAVLLRRSVAANIDYALAVRRVPKAERGARVAAALARTGLEPLADRAARVLSAGEKQRLSLARASALEPEVLFLDEPTAALDPAATRQVEEVIAELSASGCKIVMTSHDLGQARRLASEVLFMHRGRRVELTPAARFFEAPESASARQFIAGDLVV